MTILTKEMIDAFPVANMHVHLPGIITAEAALELGLRNNECRIEKGKIISDRPLPIRAHFFAQAKREGKEIYYQRYADIFADGYEIDSDGRVTNLRYNIPQGIPSTFDRFDQVMGIVQGHKYSYADCGRYRPVGGIQTPSDITYVLDAFLEKCLKANVKYVELQQNIFLSQVIFSHLAKNDAQREFFDILKQAQNKFADNGVVLNFAQCFNKSSNLSREEQAIARAVIAVDDLLHAQSRYPGLFVKLNSAGNEKAPLAHPRYQRIAYAIARQSGIALDCHAAEAGHAQMLFDAVEHLGVQIIGHGIQVVESAMAKSFAVARDLIFFVCPSMNMFLGAHLDMPDGKRTIKSIWEHPFFEMLREKVDGKYLKVALATDNPDFGGVPFKEMLMQLAGYRPEITGFPPDDVPPLSAEELYRCAVNGIDAMPNFCDRIIYRKELDEWAILSGLEVECVHLKKSDDWLQYKTMPVGSESFRGN